MIRSVVLFFPILILIGCSATGPKYSEHQPTVTPVDNSKARIFFFRESRFMSSGSDAVISINGTEVGECANNAYFYTDITPGPATISARTKAAPGEHKIALQADAGHEYYFEVLVNESYVHAGALTGLIGQSIYLENNENSCGWYFKEIANDEVMERIRDKTFSLDGE